MGVGDTVKGAAAQARRRRPSVDHLVRAYGRYAADGGGRLAASVALPGFLSFFPLIALAFFVLGFVVSGSTDAQRSILDATKDYLPGLLCSGKVAGYACPQKGGIDVDSLVKARTAAGLIGVVGLLLAGTGWVDALRNALRSVWHQNVQAGNIVVRKLRDVGILAGLGIGLLLSVAVSGIANYATGAVLDLVGFHGFLANLLVKLIGYAVSIAVNLALFLFLFAGLPKVQSPVRRVARGALFAAVGFLLLQLVGAVYIKHTTGNAVYGAFATIIGLLIWINLVCQFTLFCAAWTVTAPFDSDVAPSGTSSAEQAVEAGIPTQYAGGSADHPATLDGGGSRSPLAAAVNDRDPSQATLLGEHQDRARAATASAPPVAPTGDAPEILIGPIGEEAAGQRGPAPRDGAPRDAASRDQEVARAAGWFGVGVAAAGTAGVLVYGGRTLLDVVRSSGD